MTIVIINLTF
jgi:hypothetical protein